MCMFFLRLSSLSNFLKSYFSQYPQLYQLNGAPREVRGRTADLGEALAEEQALITVETKIKDVPCIDHYRPSTWRLQIHGQAEDKASLQQEAAAEVRSEIPGRSSEQVTHAAA